MEERTLESAHEHCEECGAKLTPQEMQMALERGGPSLCSVHASEIVPVDEASEAEA